MVASKWFTFPLMLERMCTVVVHACMYVCKSKNKDVYSSSACMYVCMYVRARIRMCTAVVHACMYICKSKNKDVYSSSACMYVCM